MNVSNTKNKPWEEFLDELPFEILMGSKPSLLLEMFYVWLEKNSKIVEKEPLTN